MVQVTLKRTERHVRTIRRRQERHLTFRFEGVFPVGSRVVLLGDPEETLGIVTGYNRGDDPYFPPQVYPVSVLFPHGESYYRLDMLMPVDGASARNVSSPLRERILCG
jgi:hypothetical protein